jgi:hypothetical protein
LSYPGPGGHAAWDRGVRRWAGELLRMATGRAVPYFSGVSAFGHVNNPPWAPGNLGLAHSVPGGVLAFRGGGKVMDRGGWLQPGWNPPLYNGTGRPERVTPDGGGDVRVRVELDITGGDQELVTLLRRIVRIRGGTGPNSVERALGAR